MGEGGLSWRMTFVFVNFLMFRGTISKENCARSDSSVSIEDDRTDGSFDVESLNTVGHEFLPPATKLGQGYVFTCVCDSVHN